MFEIAPTDSRVYEARGITWNVLLPMCDGDVSQLEGVRAFDRAIVLETFVPLAFENPPLQKSTYTVWGANHNFFNTEWQLSDAAPDSCTGPGNVPLFNPSPGSALQQVVATSSVVAFFRGNVGAGAMSDSIRISIRRSESRPT